MIQLRDIFKRYASDMAEMATPTPIKAALSADLSAHAKLNSRLYALVFCLALILVLIVILVLVRDVLNDTERYAVLVGEGLGAPLLLTSLQGIGREWSKSDLMLRLIQNSPEATVHSLVRTYLGASKR